MRVLLAAAPHADTFGYAMPPPGLLRLGGELLRRGVPVAIEDLPHRLAAGRLPRDERLAQESARLLLDVPHDVLGLSVMGATTPIALAIARRVRAAAPHVRIVLGGPGTTGIDVALLERFPWIDAVVRGEGEATLPELLGRWDAGGAGLEGLAGVTHRGGGGGSPRREPDRPPLADLAELPPYAWELVPPFEEYRRLAGGGEGLVPIDSGRGCVFDCSFCTIGRFWGRRSRVLPVERLLDEVAAVRGLPGGEKAYLCHDLFGTPRAHALEFCRGMVERALGVPWECRARLDHLDAELVEWMGRAGCYRVLLGVESGSPQVREENDKRMSAEVDPLAVVAALGRQGITPILSFILGLPGEGEQELRASLDLARDAALRAGVNLSFHLPNPQPGCRLGEEHAASSRPLEGLPPDMAFGAGETREERELIAAHPDLFGTWSLLTALPGGEARLRELHAIATSLPDVLMARPRTFALAARARGADTRELWDLWRASGRSFDDFAAREAEPLVRDALAWERAVEAAGPGVPETSRPARLVRTAADPTRAAAWLVEQRGWPPPPSAPARLAVLRGRRGVRTLRVSEDVARLIERSAAGRGSLAAEERELLGALTEGRAR